MEQSVHNNEAGVESWRTLSRLHLLLMPAPVCNFEQFRDGLFSHPVSMKKTELTPKQVSSVPCPTCGVGVRKACVLHSGSLRFGPHVERKFAAIEKFEEKSN
jgi:hypothetical protein